MGEDVASVPPADCEELGGEGLVEGVEGDVLVEVGHRGDHLKRKGPSKAQAAPRSRLASPEQAGQAPPDDLADTLGNPELVDGNARSSTARRASRRIWPSSTRWRRSSRMKKGFPSVSRARTAATASVHVMLGQGGEQGADSLARQTLEADAVVLRLPCRAPSA